MDDFVRAARDKRDAIVEELQRITERRKVLEVQLQGLSTFLDANNATKEIGLGTVHHRIIRTSLGTVRTWAPKKDIVATEVEKFLQINQPQHTKELLSHLDAINIDVGGSDRLLSLSTILSRDGRFVASRKDGWSLQEKTPDADDVEG